MRASTKMEKSCEEQESEASSTGVFEIPGEPAVVINGVPNVADNHVNPVQSDTSDDAASNKSTGLGKWLVGREVRKLFGDRFYSGTVTKFDKEAGWYRVVYEDGDLEDLEWHELEEILLPLDIMAPLKTVALKIIKNSENPTHRSGKNVARRGRPPGRKKNTKEGCEKLQ